MKLKTFYAHLFLLISVNYSTYAQWTTFSKFDVDFPEQKEEVRAFTIFNNTLFAGTTNGIYFSKNNGLNWTRNEDVQDNTRAFIKTENGLFIGFENQGLYFTDEKVKTLKEIPDLKGFSIYSLTSVGDNFYAGTTEGVYHSINKGKNWTAINTGIESIKITSLAVNGSNIFAGTEKGLYHTSDNGVTWSTENIMFKDQWIYSIISHEGMIMVASNWGISISNDNGANWTPFGKGIPSDVYSLGKSGSNLFAGTRDAGVFILTKGNENWILISTGFPEKTMVWSIAVIGNTIYAGTDEEIWMNDTFLK